MADNYEVIIQTGDVRVRIMHLQPGASTPLHHHTEVTDQIIGLTGRLKVHTQNPQETLTLESGTRCTILPGRVHQVVNENATKASYLLVQGVGRYDFKTKL